MQLLQFYTPKHNTLVMDHLPRWRVIRTGDPPHHLLSLTLIGCMENFSVHDLTLLMRSCRTVAFNKSPVAGAYKSINHPGGFSSSSFRVNRVGGSNGSASNVSIASLKKIACDANVVNSIGRHHDSVVAVPFQNTDGLVTNIVPYYARMKVDGCVGGSDNQTRFVHPPYTSLPRRGSVAHGDNLVKDIMSSLPQRLILRAFTAYRLSTSYLLAGESEFPTSTQEGMETIHRFQTDMAMLREADYHTGTDEHTDEVFSPGDYVLVSIEGEYEPAVISEVHSDNVLSVALVYSQNKRVVGRDDVKGYAQLGSFTDDDIASRSRIRIYSKMKLLRQMGCTDLEIIASKSDYTSCFDCTYGHKDTFGSNAMDSLIENKLVCPIGDADNAVVEPEDRFLGTVPPGALAYPRYKVSTVLSSENLEMHVLHDAVHFGKVLHKNLKKPDNHCSLPNKKKSSAKRTKLELLNEVIDKRGCWSNGKFFPEGGALLDWNSRYNP